MVADSPVSGQSDGGIPAGSGAGLAKDNHGFEGRTIEELWQDEEWTEYILTGGTGTVLDLIHIVDPTDTEWGPFMRPLTDGEVRTWAPSGRPTHAEWVNALETERLPYPGRACGNCTVLYRDGQPTEIAYWGVTAD
ncbi:hypothetical protein [Streptomyces sp. NPDC048825]|uniref:hypothetical protein n=1 Tax=Streptomyces sp. NPDC048825 TaxID=3365592 RepID=UPI003721A23B